MSNDLSQFAVRNGKKQFLTDYWFVQQGTSEGPEGFLTDFKWVQVIPIIIQNHLSTIQNLQRALIPQTNNWSGTFFVVSYRKPALIPAQYNFAIVRFSGGIKFILSCIVKVTARIEIVMNELQKPRMSADFFANSSHIISRCSGV